MFVKAIEVATQFTRPIHIISRNFNSSNIIPGTASLFFVNDEGWALTCGHVSDELHAIKDIEKKYQNFKREISNLTGSRKKRRNEKEIEKKYGYNNAITVQAKSRFINCVAGELNFRFTRHAEYDIALLKFEKYSKLLCDSFPVFPADTSELKQGKMLCRLGFPFPEFSNFTYDSTNDTIEWTQTGRQDTPQFPLEGMLTRHLNDNNNNIIGFELSTPGLRGQSGGPAFDQDGKVWGMQAATAHIDLNFDVDMEVIRKGTKKRLKESAFLHVGHCIHVDVLKDFMRLNGVSFNEE